MRVPIGDKDWAELKPIEELSRLDRKAVNTVVVYEIDSKTGRAIAHASMDDDVADILLSLICTDWSLPFPAPVTDPKGLDLLTLEQDNALRRAIQPYLAAIRGDNAPSPDNEVPTKGSAS
jgi:hypothetical protein